MKLSEKFVYDFGLAAAYCYQVYGSELIVEDEHFLTGFICPSCGEPILECDWSEEDTDNWHKCPICEEYFVEE